VVLAGSGDGVVDAAAAGLLHGDEALLYAADLTSSDRIDEANLVIVTDSNRDRAHQWRGTQDVVGFTETGGPASDLLQRDTADQRLPVFATQLPNDQTTAHVEGLDIKATSYGEPFAYRPEDRPAMAADGDPTTAWLVADRSNPIGQSLEVAGDLSGLSLLQSQQLGASRMISSVRLDFDSGASQVVALDDTSLAGSGQRVDVPQGSKFVRITITAVADRPGATDPGLSAVGFAELGLGAHLEVVSVPTDASDVSAATPLAIVLTRLRADPLDRWRSDPEPQLVRAFRLGTDRSLAARITLRQDARASDEVLNTLAGVATATSNQRLTGDPRSTAAQAIDGDLASAWTSPFSNAVGSTLDVPLDPMVPVSSFELTQSVDQQHSTITSVTVTVGGVSTAVDVPAPDGDGRSTIQFPAASGSNLLLTVDGIDVHTTVDRRYGEPTVLPVAIREISAPTIAAPRPLDPPPDCRTDLVEIDGRPLPVAVSHDDVTRLVSGAAVDVEPCDGAPLELAQGEHRLTTTPGIATGVDVDRVVLSSQEPPVEPASSPTVSVQRSRTTRTATVAGCPAGCWLIFGEGYNDGWRATMSGSGLGAPRPISGGFNGWWLPGSNSPVTVTMTWTPQRTMWIGMFLAALAILACVVLIWRDRTIAEMQVPRAAVPAWPVERVGRRQAVIVACVLAVLATVSISPAYGAIAAVVGLAVVALRRPALAGVGSLVLISALAALIIRRQLRYHLVANPSWPAAFDDLHRFGLLVVVLLLASTIVDECPDEESEQLT
ncbi:MAG TPA: hypothetical protein VHN36_09990, partial [Ilumatobacteraceae bacterium]|nr:hypothetical protein [Ilumatobacteraceae bacterium]